MQCNVTSDKLWINTFVWALCLWAQTFASLNHTESFLQPVHSLLKPNSTGQVFYPKNLKNENIRADYVIITNDVFYQNSDLDLFAEHRAQTSEFGVAIVNGDSIYSQFYSGEKQESIKSFLTHIFYNWSSFNLLNSHPRYVLLVGEGNPGSPSYLPSYQFYQNNVATDFWYACLNDDNSDGVLNKDDKEFDLVIGRFSVDDESELSNIVTKIIQYENRQIKDDDWSKRISLVSLFENEPQTTYRVEKLFDSISQTVTGNKFYHIANKMLKTDWDGKSLKYYFYDAFNGGNGILNVHAHGDIQSLGNGAGWFLFQESDTMLVQNNKYPVVLSFACNSGNFHNRDFDCTGEILLNLRNRGAVAFIGSVEPVLLDINLEMNLHLMEILEQIENISLGEAFFYARELTGASYKYNLLGDPAMSLSGTEVANSLMPDLSISPEHIHFHSGDKWTQAAVSASVINNGMVPVQNVKVGFYASSQGEQILIGQKTIFSIPPNGGFKKASVVSDLQFEPGMEIIARIDEPNSIAELDESNNIASIKLLPDLAISREDVEICAALAFGYPDTLKVTIHNLGYYEANNILVQAFEETAGALIQIGKDVVVEKLSALRSTMVVLQIQHGFQQNPKIHIQLDGENDIWESNEENNNANAYENFLPDLTIQAKDIFHYRVSPQKNKDRVSVKIYNMGFFDANNATVRIYQGHPNIDGVQLGEDVIVDVPGHGGYKQVFHIIDHVNDKKVFIYAVVDPDSLIEELDEENNSALSLSVRSILNTAGEFPSSAKHTYSAMGDLNNDNLQDILLANSASLSLYQNDENGTFFLLGEWPNVADPSNIYAPTFVDFNNDGRLDVYLADNCLLRNSQLDILQTAELFDPSSESMKPGNALAFLDANNDGRLDILSSYYDPKENNREYDEQLYSQRLLQNVSANVYKDVTAESGLYPKLDPAMGGNVAAVSDFDNDGDSDLYLAVNNNFNRVNYKFQRLFANNGDGTFENVTQIVGLAEVVDNIVTKAEFADYDNDGDMDLFIGGQFSNLIIYQNNNGVFTKISTAINLSNREFQTLLDYNNDGFVDLFFSLYEEDSDQSWQFLRNNKSGGFELDQDASENYKSIPHLVSSAFGDYNNDGFVDMLCTFRDTSSVLFQNYGNSNSWIHINLQGRESNSFGIGARVRIIAGDLSQEKEMHCLVDPLQKVQHNPTLEYGLGNQSSIDSIIVKWPSGQETILTDQKINSILTITESANSELIPKKFQVFQNYPNPFNSSTTINYGLPKAAYVRIDIFDILGRRIKSVVNLSQQSGAYSIQWNGLNENDLPVAAGVYFCRFKSGDEYERVYKMVLVK